MNFDFVNDEQIKKMLIRDYSELLKCFDIQASKSVLILTGSILEAVFVDFFLSKDIEPDAISKLHKEGLDSLILRAYHEKLISQNNKDFSAAIKGYRNLIHPGREVRLKEEFNFDTASVSFSALKLILNEIELKSLSSRGRTADDIFKKLMNEGLEESLFIKISDKLNKTEKIKLFLNLVEVDLEDNGLGAIHWPYGYAKHLKGSIDTLTYQHLSNEHIKEVESGSKLKALKYSKYFYERFDQFMSGNDLDIVTELLYNEGLQRLSKTDDLRFSMNHKIFEAILFNSRKLHNVKELQSLLNSLSYYFKDSNSGYLYMDLWTIIHGYLDEELYQELTESFQSLPRIVDFIEKYDNGDYLPF